MSSASVSSTVFIARSPPRERQAAIFSAALIAHVLQRAS
jgi:hypothetical protein